MFGAGLAIFWQSAGTHAKFVSYSLALLFSIRLKPSKAAAVSLSKYSWIDSKPSRLVPERSWIPWAAFGDNEGINGLYEDPDNRCGMTTGVDDPEPSEMYEGLDFRSVDCTLITLSWFCSTWAWKACPRISWCEAWLAAPRPSWQSVTADTNVGEFV